MLQHRSANFRPSTWDANARTVEAIISTGAGVKRRDARGPFTETLSLRGANTERLQGAPVLNAHRQGDLRDVIGTVDRVRMDDGALVATLRFSSRPDVEPVLGDIRDGILRGVSLGYAVQEWRDGVHPQDGTRVREAVAWTPHEVSLVPVPADPGATIRSESMLESENPEGGTPTPEQARAATRASIRTIARSAGLTTEWADSQIDAEADVTAVRAAAFDAMQKRSKPEIRVQQIGPSNEDPNVILERRADALFSRITGAAPKPESREYVGDRLVDHAGAILAMRGVPIKGLTPEGVLTRAAMHTISDFPNLLTSTGQRVLMSAYEAAVCPLKALARTGSRPDFRPGSQLRIGEVGQLQKVTEAGEIKSISRAESVESYALDTYGSMFALSRKAIINDDLGAFRDWGTAAGRAAAETEAGVLITMFTANSGGGPTMHDGNPLFYAGHGNLAGSGGPPDGSGGSLNAARLAMRSQTGLDGKTPINATPKYLLVPAAIEGVAEAALAAIYPAHQDDVNVWTNRLTLMVEARLTNATAWYLFADPAVLPVIEYSYLTSAPGPQMASRDGWDVLGREFRVHLDFGCGPVDWRGAYRNPGA